METICGLGLPEMLILALLAFVFIGPERSRDVALQAGRFLRNVMSSEWWSDFNAVTDAMRDLPNTLVRMAEIEEAQKEIEDTIRDINTVTQIDPTAPTPQTAPPDEDMVTDPWGIANATAQTQYTPQPNAVAQGQDIPPDNDAADDVDVEDIEDDLTEADETDPEDDIDDDHTTD